MGYGSPVRAPDGWRVCCQWVVAWSFLGNDSSTHTPQRPGLVRLACRGRQGRSRAFPPAAAGPTGRRSAWRGGEWPGHFSGAAARTDWYRGSSGGVGFLPGHPCYQPPVSLTAVIAQNYSRDCLLDLLAVWHDEQPGDRVHAAGGACAIRCLAAEGGLHHGHPLYGMDHHGPVQRQLAGPPGAPGNYAWSAAY